MANLVGLRSKASREQDLEARFEEAEGSEQWYRTLFQALAHEVSQPLTTLGGEAELALATAHTESEYRAVLENSLAELDRLNETVRRFREFAELENPAARSPISILDPLRKILELLAPAAESLGVELNLDAPLEYCVVASAERLERALHKLVQRALDRNGRGGKVSVAASTSGDFAIIKIADEGPEVSSREASSRLDCRSNGLEWVFARRFAESSGGTFTIQSGANQGCVVCLTLPLAAERNS